MRFVIIKLYLRRLVKKLIISVQITNSKVFSFNFSNTKQLIVTPPSKKQFFVSVIEHVSDELPINSSFSTPKAKFFGS